MYGSGFVAEGPFRVLSFRASGVSGWEALKGFGVELFFMTWGFYNTTDWVLRVQALDNI